MGTVEKQTKKQTLGEKQREEIIDALFYKKFAGDFVSPVFLRILKDS